MLKKTTELAQPEAGQLIRKLRYLTGLSQEQFAALLGVSFSTINRWENGHIQPSPLALKQVKSILNEFKYSPIVELRQRSQTLLNQYFTTVESKLNND